MWRSSMRFKGKPGDIPLLVAVAAMACFGIVMVYSASNYTAEVQYGDAFYFVKKQVIGVVLGLAGLVLLTRLEPAKLKKIKWTALIVPLVLLALVFVPGIGKSNYGATRWIGFGSFTIQPSELAKYGFVIFSSAYIAEDPARVRSFHGILPVLFAGIAVCGLIIAEPNMSVTMCVALLMAAMIFLSGTKLRNVACIALPIVLAVPVLILMEPYRLKRLSAYLDPWASPQGEGYQLIQSLYALGNGGWFGTGLFDSRQKFRFLPFAESDFILAIIGEELGFVGILCVFAAAGFIVWRGIRIALRQNDFFCYLLAMGITLVYGIQVLVNALVVSGTIPPTGLPLPLVSAGNTSLIVTLSSVGILYRLSKQS